MQESHLNQNSVAATVHAYNFHITFQMNIQIEDRTTATSCQVQK